MRTLPLHLVLAVLLVRPGSAATHSPTQFSGSDSQKLQKAMDAWAKDPGSLLDLSNWTGTLDKPVTARPAGKDDRLTGRIQGNPLWWAITADFPGPMVTLRDAKGLLVSGLSLRNNHRAGSGLYLVTSGSSSAVSFYDFQFHGPSKGNGYALKAEGLDGADVSGYSFYSCLAEGAGFVMAGTNTLDPYFSNARASHAKIGFDLRAGGSLGVLDHCGGSYNDETIVVNGGYPVSIRDAWSELSGTLVRLGGDDAGGYGQETDARVSILDARSMTGPTVKVYKAGKTVIDAMGGSRLSIDAVNRNTAAGQVEVTGKPMKVSSQGPFRVGGSLVLG